MEQYQKQFHLSRTTIDRNKINAQIIIELMSFICYYEPTLLITQRLKRK